jgi:trk system potassium uptake protein TrkA
MKIIICGAGQVGWQIARHLAGERNDVTIVDSDEDLVRRATDQLDVKGVTGFASYPDVLARAGAEDADMIIAARSPIRSSGCSARSRASGRRAI